MTKIRSTDDSYIEDRRPGAPGRHIGQGNKGKGYSPPEYPAKPTTVTHVPGANKTGRK